ncbi:MAG: OB-fold nucleic acid binding domain-containing protein, partial [Bacteroidota bacterium]
MNRTYVEDLSRHVGEEVTLRGWLYNKRSSGKIRFLVLRDGTGLVQGVLVKGAVPDELFQQLEALTQESSLVMRGKVRADARAPGGYEMEVSGLEVINIAADYP